MVGLALVHEHDKSVSSVVAVTAVGRAVRVEVGAALGGPRIARQSPGPAGGPDVLFYFHTAAVQALAVERSAGGAGGGGGKVATGKGSLVATGGDDRYLHVWCGRRRALLARCRAPAPLRCLDFDSSSASYLAAGMAGGGIAIFGLQAKAAATMTGPRPPPFARATNGAPTPTADYVVTLLATRRDCQSDISDVKFSPNCRMLAVGSHDDCIDLYAVTYETRPAVDATGAASHFPLHIRCYPNRAHAELLPDRPGLAISERGRRCVQILRPQLPSCIFLDVLPMISLFWASFTRFCLQALATSSSDRMTGLTGTWASFSRGLGCGSSRHFSRSSSPESKSRPIWRPRDPERIREMAQKFIRFRRYRL